MAPVPCGFVHRPASNPIVSKCRSMASWGKGGLYKWASDGNSPSACLLFFARLYFGPWNGVKMFRICNVLLEESVAGVQLRTRSGLTVLLGVRACTEDEKR